MAGSTSKNPLQRASFALEHALSNLFGWLGYNVAKRPGLTIALSILLALGLGVGWSQMVTESRPDKLWIPQGSIAAVDEEWSKAYFNTVTSIASVLCYKEGGNLFELSNLKECWRAWQIQMDVAIEYKGVWYSWNGGNVTGHDFTTRTCNTMGELECETITIWDLWDKSDDLIMALTQEDLYNAINDTDFITGPNNKEYPISAVVSGDTNFKSGKPPNAEALNSFFYWQDSDETYFESSDGSMVDPIIEPLALLQYDTIGSATFPFDVYQYSQKAWGNEFGNAISNDIVGLGIAILAIIFYLVVALGRRDPVFSARLLSVGAVVTILLSVIAGLGLCDLLGVDRNALTNSLYFLLLGLGVDDAFIIQGEFQNQTRDSDVDEKTGVVKASIADRMKRTTQRAGVSIFVTSLTDVTAFAIGASSSLPALSSFCASAASCVFFVFLFNVTFFTACVTLDAKRAEPPVQRHDCCPCCIAQRPHRRFASKEDQVGCCGIPRKSGNWNLCRCAPDLGTTIAKEYIGPVIVKFRYFVPIPFALFLAIAIWGATLMEQDFKFSWFLPGGAPIVKWYDLTDELFANSALPYEIYLGDIDYHAKESDIITLGDTMENKVYTFGTVDSFSKIFRTHIDDTSLDVSTADKYYQELKTWLTTVEAGQSHRSKVVWKDDSDPTVGIAASQLNHAFSRSYVDTADEQAKMLETVRNDAGAVIPYPDARVFTYTFIYWEQYAVIAQEFWRNVGLAFLAVAIIILFMVPDLVVAVLVFLCVVSSIICLIGFMWHWDVPINSVSTIYMVVSIGLTVDYAVHVGHGYLYVRGTRAERAVETLGRVGVSVFNGAFSTFIATCVLATSSTYIFQTFFKCLFLCVVFGLAHGMILLPALLAMIGPSTFFELDKTDGVEDNAVEMMDSTTTAGPAGGDTTTMGSDSKVATGIKDEV